MTREYCEAAVEVLDILDHTEQEKVSLIPVKFLNYLRANAAKDYVAHLDYSKPVNEMNIKKETKGILGTICLNWWWSPDQKQEYKRLVSEKEMKRQEDLRTKYNPDDVFKNKTQAATTVQPIQEQSSVTNTAMVEQKESAFKKIINKILSLFKK